MARERKGIAAGIAVGAVIALEAMFAGPICGASMNPARSLGPALVTGQIASVWIYLTAPVLGAARLLCAIGGGGTMTAFRGGVATQT